jgi:hypothetical protein
MYNDVAALNVLRVDSSAQAEAQKEEAVRRAKEV